MPVIADDPRLDRDDAVLRLVRVALGTAPDAGDVAPVDTALIERAARLGVLEQVVAAAATVGFTDDAEAIAASTARARALRGMQQEAMTWRIQHLLADAHVEVLALKGAALAAMTGRSGADRCGVDTDVLVQATDWPRAHDILTASGYALVPGVPPPREHDSLTRFVTFSANEAAYLGPGGPVDVHWRLGPGHLASLSSRALFARAVTIDVAGASIATLDPDAMLAHVALHGAKDRWGSLRTLVDAHLLVAVAGASWEGAADLVGHSSVVSHARAAVGWAIEGTSNDGSYPADVTTTEETLTRYFSRRAGLAPSTTSLVAVASKLVLPPQLLAASQLPRQVWWLAIGPRIGRAVWWGVRTAATGPGVTSTEPASRLGRRLGYAASFTRDLARWYGGLPSSASTYRISRRMHVRTAGTSSAALVRVMRGVPGAADRTEQDEAQRARARVERALDELRATGLTIVDPPLGPGAVSQLRAFAERAPARLRLADGRVIDGTYAERPPDTTSVTISGTFAWANGEVQHVMASPWLHDLALARFGLAPVVQTPMLYWSCRPSVSPDSHVDQLLARKFHMDFDGLQAIRVHLYLTDVDGGTAPMQYVRGSHQVGALRGREFRAADQSLDDQTVTDRFGSASIATVTGPAGTTFVTDPRGLHRGTAPLDRDRLFMVMPIQAGAFAGYVRRRRAVPVRDEAFGRLLDVPVGPLRLFAASTVSDAEHRSTAVARLAP